MKVTKEQFIGMTYDELLAENTRLWEVISDAEESARLILGESRALEAENTKLRELLRDAIYARDDADWASIVSAAIALGVEVE